MNIKESDEYEVENVENNKEIDKEKVDNKVIEKEKEVNEKEKEVNEKEKKEYIKINSEEIIKIYNIKSKKVEEMKFEDYIKGVIAAEMGSGFYLEALKAQAVAARTYAYYRLNKFSKGHPDHHGAAICNGIHCQAYLSMDTLKEVKAASWMKDYWPQIVKAVDTTVGEVIFYNGEVIEPLFHSVSGGQTENSEDVFVSAQPYLRSVNSPNEEKAPGFTSIKKFTISEFIKKIKNTYSKVNLTKSNLSSKIVILEKSSSGKIKKMKIDNITISGRDFRSMFNLYSTEFNVSVYNKVNTVEIKTKGVGHGVGMSQFGANGMAKNGHDYYDILTHYYTDIKIEKIY